MKKTFITRADTHLFRLRKRIYHQIKIPDGRPQIVLFTIGCQRSGTTLVLQIFDRDYNTKVYSEIDKLITTPVAEKYGRFSLRLKPFNLIKKEIERNKVSLIVLKPLVETQNSLELLDYFEGSRALWLYRHYRDVTLSNLKRFGVRNGINNLRPIVEKDPHNWRSERVPDEVRRIVLDFFSEDMDPYDAAALFWYVRNSLFFQLNLGANPNVMMCKYEDLVTSPAQTMQRVYKFLGHDFPGKKIVTQVHSESVRKGRHVELSPEIEKLCADLLAKLNQSHSQTKNDSVKQDVVKLHTYQG